MSEKKEKKTVSFADNSESSSSGTSSGSSDAFKAKASEEQREGMAEWKAGKEAEAKKEFEEFKTEFAHVLKDYQAGPQRDYYWKD